jgi:predicted kinase
MDADGNHVCLLVGPRGSGKSHYAKRLQESYPGLVIISRDEILIRKFGSIHTSPYTGEQWYAMELMHRLLRRRLCLNKDTTILLDCWTGDHDERRELVQQLRGYGAARVTALYFMTPLELVDSWFWLKPGIAKIGEKTKPGEEGLVYYSPQTPSHDYQTFHRLASTIDSDGFDQVIRINPLVGPIQMRLPDGYDEVVRIGL